MDRVVGGDDAAAGHRVDDVDLVEQPAASAPYPELHVPQRFHRSVRQRRRARASARQGQDDQHIAGVVGIGLDPLRAGSPWCRSWVAIGALAGCRASQPTSAIAPARIHARHRVPKHCVEYRAHGCESRVPGPWVNMHPLRQSEHRLAPMKERATPAQLEGVPAYGKAQEKHLRVQLTF